MVLDAEDGGVLRAQALAGLVVQAHVGDAGAVREARRVHGEGVVLAGDVHPPALHILDGVVGAVVAEFQFVRFAP